MPLARVEDNRNSFIMVTGTPIGKRQSCYWLWKALFLIFQQKPFGSKSHGIRVN